MVYKIKTQFFKHPNVPSSVDQPTTGEGGREPSDRPEGAPRSAFPRVRGPAAVWAAVLVALSAVAFSAKAVIAKLMYREGLDPIATLALRMAFAAPVYVLVALWSERGARRLTGRELLGIVGLGVAGYYGSSALDFIGLQYVSAGVERLILFTYPTIVVLMSRLFLSEPVRPYQVLALIVTYAGIALVLRAELALSGDGGDVALGAALVVGAALTYAGYLVGATPFIRSLGPRRFTALALLVATAAVLAHAVARGASLLDHSPRVYGLGFVMGLGCTVFPTFALAEGIRRLGPGPSAILGTVGPVSTLFLAHWLLGEPIFALQVAGTALVLGGATAVAWRAR